MGKIKRSLSKPFQNLSNIIRGGSSVILADAQPHEGWERGTGWTDVDARRYSADVEPSTAPYISSPRRLQPLPHPPEYDLTPTPSLSPTIRRVDPPSPSLSSPTSTYSILPPSPAPSPTRTRSGRPSDVTDGGTSRFSMDVAGGSSPSSWINKHASWNPLLVVETPTPPASTGGGEGGNLRGWTRRRKRIFRSRLAFEGAEHEWSESTSLVEGHDGEEYVHVEAGGSDEEGGDATHCRSTTEGEVEILSLDQAVIPTPPNLFTFLTSSILAATPHHRPPPPIPNLVPLQRRRSRPLPPTTRQVYRSHSLSTMVESTETLLTYDLSHLPGPGAPREKPYVVNPMMLCVPTLWLGGGKYSGKYGDTYGPVGRKEERRKRRWSWRDSWTTSRAEKEDLDAWVTVIIADREFVA